MAATLLGRFRGHLARHDWFAVGVDFLIVVVGVIVGIEASNWNQGRQDRAEERRYYAQIVRDLQQDLETFRIARVRSLENDRSADRTLAALDGGIPAGADPRKAVADLHYAGFLYLPRPARGTYDELLSTGNLGVLRSEEVKASIADYYERFEENRQWDNLLREQQGEYWHVTAGVLPRPVLRSTVRRRPPAVSRSEAEKILESARARPRMRDLLVGMAAHQERVRRDSELQQRLAERLIRQLEPLAD